MEHLLNICLFVVRAQSNARDGLAGSLGSALGVAGTQGRGLGGWAADQSTVLGASRSLKSALRLSSDTGGLVRGAEDASGAGWGAEATFHTGDGHVFFLGQAGSVKGITVVGLAWGGTGAWAGAGTRAGARRRAGAGARGNGLAASWVRSALGDTALVHVTG